MAKGGNYSCVDLGKKRCHSFLLAGVPLNGTRANRSIILDSWLVVYTGQTVGSAARVTRAGARLELVG